MKYDDKFEIAVGLSAKSKRWENTKTTWSAFVKKLKSVHRTPETLAEYAKANKGERSRLKDVGGYVGGYLRNQRRKPENVLNRRLLTLDLDYADATFWDVYSFSFEHAAVVHSTHSHTDATPRYRLIMPLDREVTPDEYVAISRYVAGVLDIELFDDTTFETNRLMFWPSVSKDAEYIFEVLDAPFLNADEALATYTDWTDSSAWPLSSRKTKDVKRVAKHQQDPALKKGVIGSFCRVYDIAGVIEEYLSEEYTATVDADRYTYTQGSAAGGLIVYDDKFAFSHHGTDPASGQLCNVFDLMRLHKFGHLDEPGSPGGASAKSYKAAVELVRSDAAVKRMIAEDTFAAAKYEFAETDDDDDDDEGEADAPTEAKKDEKPKDPDAWLEELEVDARGAYLSTANNLNLIFKNDPRIANKFAQNEFDGKEYVSSDLPWRSVSAPEPVKNVDFAGLRNYIETFYGISAKYKVEDAYELEVHRRSFHPVREYLNGLKWDGIARIDELLVDYFGTEDTEYTRRAIRVMLTGAVARIFVPGIKFDLAMIFVGRQGDGKSTFIRKLAGDLWFSDNFNTVHGKESQEQIQGVWLMEMAELNGMRKAEVDAVKHYISKQVDSFRGAYKRVVEGHKRQNVFFGSTNNHGFLKDPTGNRRFLPIDVDRTRAVKSVFSDSLSEERDQIWAEACHLFSAGEPLYLTGEAEAAAREQQREHSETDERLGIIEHYLSIRLPEPRKWAEMAIYERINYVEQASERINNDEPMQAEGTHQRETITVAELWCECFGKDKRDLSRHLTRDLNDVIRMLEGWEYAKKTKRFGAYGTQNYYRRVVTEDSRGLKLKAPK